MSLTRLFSVIYTDGTTFKQPPDDRSVNHDPASEWNPSSFRDIDQNRLAGFFLEDRQGRVVRILAAVNLIDGSAYLADRGCRVIESIGVDNLDVPHGFEHLKLIYFRQMRVTTVNGVPGEPEIERYCLGYEGKNRETGDKVKLIIGVDP